MYHFINKLTPNKLNNEPSFDFSESIEFDKVFQSEIEGQNNQSESLNDEYLLRAYFIDKNAKNNIQQNLNELTENTEPNSDQKFTSQKRKRTTQKDTLNNKEEPNSKFEILKDASKNKKKGRRKTSDINNKIIAAHNKSSEDNKIRKLKRYLLDFVLLILNHSIKCKSVEFRPLDKKMKERLKRDENLELLNKTIADIFSNTKMNKVSEKKGKSNKDLIEKIYEENIETETIKILDMTFQEILNEIRDKYLDDFLRGIKEKEIKVESKNKKNNNYQKDFDIEKYLDEIKDLLFRFEEWFKEKNGRNRIKEDIN